MAQEVPHCPSCDGVMKPNITFFGENLPGNVKRAVETDYKKVRQVLGGLVLFLSHEEGAHVLNRDSEVTAGPPLRMERDV